jgi:hypothetical protein
MNEPDWLSQLDQTRAGLRDLASVLAGYMTALVDAGFNRGEALQITIAWQTAIMGAPRESE